MRRRAFLASGGATFLSASTAGCLGWLLPDGADPAERWSYEFTPEEVAGPVAVGGYAYLGIEDRVVGLDLESGAVETEHAVTAGALATAPETLLVADEGAGELLAISPGEADPRWRAPMRLFPPPVDEQRVYLSDSETVSARDLETGAVEWELPASEASWGLFERIDDLVVGVGDAEEGANTDEGTDADEGADAESGTDREWVAVDAEAGEVVWRTPRAGHGRTPILAGSGVIFAGNESEEPPAAVQGLASDDGTEGWAYEVENTVAEPVAAVGGTVVVSGRGRRVETTAALAVETGDERWHRQDRLATVHDGVVYTIRGRMAYGIDADVATPQWSSPVEFVDEDGTPRADATVIGDGLVVGADGEFVSFHLEHGTERWTYSADRRPAHWGGLDDAFYHVGDGTLTLLDVE